MKIKFQLFQPFSLKNGMFSSFSPVSHPVIVLTHSWMELNNFFSLMNKKSTKMPQFTCYFVKTV